MKLISDLRLNNAQATEQFTALILAGVAAVVIGGVAHMGVHRSHRAAVAPVQQDLAFEQEPMAQPLPAASAAAMPILVAPPSAVASVAQPVLDAEPVQSTSISYAAVSHALAPLVMAPVTAPWLQQAVTAAVPPAKPELIVRTVEAGRNTSLTKLLVAEADLEEADVAAVSSALAKVYKGKLPSGAEISLRFTQLGEEEKFTGLSFQPEVTSEVRVNRLADGTFKAERIVTPVERQRFAVEGTVRTSLIEAGVAQGVPRNVMSSMLRAFSHEVDFQRDIHPGDKFRVLYDQPHTKSGQPAGDATIIYAAIASQTGQKAVFRVIYSDGSAEYFNDRGESVRRGLMRTPIDGAHVTSNYGMRRHPIMGYSKFHQGVDFAAPTGTPIFAAGDGVVKEVGFRSGYGRFVLIQHRSGLETAYAHMSRFARGLQEGDRVNQGEVIAYVGSTGRSTGPHLHFEVRVNKAPVNPLKVDMQAGNKLNGRGLAQFRAGKAAIENEFRRRATAAKPATVKLAAVAHDAAD